MAALSNIEAGVLVGGVPLADSLVPLLERVVVDDHVLLPAMFELAFRDPERDVLARGGFQMGTEVQIAVGATMLVTGEVTSFEGEYDSLGTHAIVRGYDRLHRLHRGRKTRVWTQVTDAEVVRKVAGAEGIQLGQIDTTPITHEHVVQANQSDWEFLTARARAIGYELAIAEGRLELRKPARASEAPPPGTLESDGTRRLVAGKSLRSFRPRVTAAEQVGTIEVRGWDPDRKEAVVATADAATVGAQLDDEPSDVASTFGSPTYVSVERPLSKQAEADAVAAALAEGIASAFAEAEGVANGDASLRAGTTVSVALVADRFAGRYTLTSTRHVFDRDGYRTQFVVSGRQQRSLLGLASNGASGTPATFAAAFPGTAIGVVTDTKDPENRGRVKVKFPWLSEDYVSDWARVAYPGAGKERGIVWVPEADDEVLVGFVHGEFGRPCVLGGLFNGVDPPEGAAELVNGTSGAIDSRRLVSRTGHKLAFEDSEDGGSILVRTGGQQPGEIELDAAAHVIRITSNGDVEIEGKGAGKITIKAGTSMALEAATSLELKAAQITLDGSTRVEVKSTGDLQLQGTQTTVKGDAAAQIDGGALLTIQGALVTIN